MQRIRPHLALITLLVLITGQTAVAQSDEGGTSYASDDGLATLVVPSGSVPEGSDITVSYRPHEEAPPELAELAGNRAPSHYAIEPMDVTFDPPARFIRQVPLAMLGVRAEDPQVLWMLAIRDSTGAWSWASDLGYGIDAAAELLLLSGDITSGGQVSALESGVVWPGAVGVMGDVGEESMTEWFFYDESYYGLSTAHEITDPVITDAVGATGDPEVATVGETIVSNVGDEPDVNLPLQCMSPGETTAEVTFTLDGVGDDLFITSGLELPATAVEVNLVGSIECFR
jgi:hypothetical protein